MSVKVQVHTVPRFKGLISCIEEVGRSLLWQYFYVQANFFETEHFQKSEYRTRAIKGRADYSKIIFFEFSAASNQERLQFKKYFLDLFLPQTPCHFKYQSDTKTLIWSMYIVS